MIRKRIAKYIIPATLFFLVGSGQSIYGEDQPRLSKQAETEIRNELNALKQKVQQLETLLQQYQSRDAGDRKPENSKSENQQPETGVSPQQFHDLDQQVRILQRQRELDLEDDAKKAAAEPKITADKKGFSITSPNKDFQLKLRGYMQADARFFPGDETNLTDDTFTMRRIRPIMEGNLWDYYYFRLMTDFGGGNATVQDAYLDIQYLPEFQVLAGKYKSPVGLERLQSAANLLFVERGLPTSLIPNRDVGVQLHGDFLDGRLSYVAGVLNGVADLSSADLNVGDGVEFAGRLFSHPFLQSDIAALKGFGFGVAGTYGDQDGKLPSFVTQGQAKFFNYEADAKANGEHTRLSPQAYYFYGPFSLLGEYVISSQDVERTKVIDKVENKAWQVQASYVLTGEDASYKGVKPKKPLNFSTGDWGAFELAARYGELSVDDDIFTDGYAKDTVSPRRANECVFGINWYFNENALFKLNFAHTEFSDGAASGDRDDENAILTRFQISF